MQIKKSILIVFCMLFIIFLNERLFYMGQIGSSMHVMGLLSITVTLFLVYIKAFFEQKFLFRRVVLYYILINIVSLVVTNIQFGQPIVLGILRYKYIFVVLLYFPLCMMIYRVGTEKIKKLIVTLTSFLSFVYIMQAILYPNIIFLNVNYADRFGFTRFYDGAYFIVIGLFITISYLYANYNKSGKLKYYLAFLLQISYIVFVAQTRSSIIPILGIIILVLLSRLSFNNVLSYFKVLAMLIIGLIILMPYITDVINSIKTDVARTDGSAQIRVQAKEYVAEKIKENPIFGTGLYNAQYEEGQWINGSIYKYYAEDIGIKGFIFQYGYVGMILYLVMIGRFLYLSFRIFKYNREKGILYVIFCAYSCLQMPFTVTLNVDNTLIYLVMFMALIQIDYNKIYNEANNSVS